MNKYRLYGRPGSGSLAVQIALEEIGAPFDRIWVGDKPADLAAFRAISPMGRVPALVLPDGTAMFESAAMLVHLALAHPDAALAPASGTTPHALFLQWMTFLSANVYEAALRFYYSDRYSARGEVDAAAIREQAGRDFLAHLELISGHLHPYVLGGRFSIADAYLHMLAGWYPAVGRAELHARVPALRAHAKLLLGRAAVGKVEADHAS